MAKNGKGWHGERKRHRLAARGIKTAQKTPRMPKIRQIKPLPLNSNRLPVQFGIIVPSTEGDKPLSDVLFKRRVEKEKELFSKLFGGDTSVESVGGYYDGQEYIKEDGVIVWASMTPEKYMRMRKGLAEHIKIVQKRWKQDTVLYKIEGEDYIYPKRPYISHDDSKKKSILVS